MLFLPSFGCTWRKALSSRACRSQKQSHAANSDGTSWRCGVERNSRSARTRLSYRKIDILPSLDSFRFKHLNISQVSPGARKDFTTNRIFQQEMML